MLRDRLVCGVRDEALQRRLLAETTLDFKKAYEKAVAAEYATRQTAATRGALAAASDLHRMDQAPEEHKPGGKQDSGKQSTTGRCSRCNGDHDTTSCGFRYSVCHFCKRKVHTVRSCRQKEAARSKAKRGNKRPGKSDHSRVYGLYHIASALPAFMVTVIVNGRQISMEVDSGFVCSIVNLRTLSKLGISKKVLRPCSQGVRTYTQQPVWVVGEVDVPVKYNGREGELPLLVTKGSGISILGRDWLIPLGISLEGLHQLNGAPVSNSSRGEGQPAAHDHSKVVTSVKTVLRDYSEVFKPGLGKSTGPLVRIEVEEQGTPKFHKPWQVPFALLPKVEEAIEQLVKQGIYVPRYFLDGSRNVRHFYPGDAVYARNYQGGTKWVPGFITSVTGALSYQVRLSDGSLWRRHDQIRSRATPLDLGGADSDSGGDTADDVDPSVVGQNPPLPGVSEALPSSIPPVSPAPEPDNAVVPGSPSQEQSSPNQPKAAEAFRYP
ncbi:hypothetical protein MTO96_031942 [Rhipicephalus appendiculatus]